MRGYRKFIPQQGSSQTDKYGGGTGDRDKVSCKQTHYIDEDGNKKSYNELQNMIDKYYKYAIDDAEFYQHLCYFCKDKASLSEDYKNQWEALYTYLETKGYTKK